MQTFTTPSPIDTLVDVPAAHLRFVAAERADTRVEVRPADAAKSRDVKAAERTTVAFENGVLRVATPQDNALFGPSGAVEVTVQLPAGSSIRATGSAELRGAGSFGEVVVDRSTGPVKVDEAATVRVSALDGDVAIGRLTGPGEVATARGAVQIGEALQGAVVVSTQFGDLSVGVPAGIAAGLDAGTSSGRITNTLTNAAGEPVVLITATTASGDIDAHSV